MTINIKGNSGVTSAYIGSSNEEYSEESGDALGDAEALRVAMRDARYATSASYRKTVENAIAASMVIKSDAPGASALSGGQLNGRYQVRGNPMDEAPAADRQLTEHEQAMIAKAEKHGF
jgi:hypothetical protein